jgi:hypothetical protein
VDDTEKYFDELEEMFATQGWRNLVEEAKAQIYQFQSDALEQTSWDRVCELRGQVMQLARLVNLEEVTAFMRAQSAEASALDANV